MIERTCENCEYQIIENIGRIEQQMFCILGEVAFMECQCACTDDYFEVRAKKVKLSRDIWREKNEG